MLAIWVLSLPYLNINGRFVAILTRWRLYRRDYQRLLDIAGTQTTISTFDFVEGLIHWAVLLYQAYSFSRSPGWSSIHESTNRPIDAAI